MSNAYDAVRQLLTWYGKATPKLLAKHLGITRQVASRHLQKMTKRGQLQKVGARHAIRYVRIEPEASRYIAVSFWERIARDAPAVVRIDLGRPAVALRLRRQVKTALEHLEPHQKFVFLDFNGVEEASEAFLDELLNRAPGLRYRWYAVINANEAIKKLLARVRIEDDSAGVDDSLDYMSA